jgi:hypothetical protein
VSDIVRLLTSMDFSADTLAQGSTQATADPSSAGNDQPFWDALNANIKNLHAVISGHGQFADLQVLSWRLSYDCVWFFTDHGNEWCAREPSKDVIFCFDKHSGYVAFI